MAEPGTDPAATARVLLLLGHSSGGIRRHVAELARRLAGRGWRVSTAGPAGVLDGLAPQDAVVDVPAGAWPQEFLRARRQLRRVAAGVDLVHAHGQKAAFLAATLPLRAGLVVTVHNVVLDDVAGRAAVAMRVLERLLPRLADRVLAVSDAVAARFPDSAGVVTVDAFAAPPNPVRTPTQVRDELGVPQDAPLVVTVARLHPQKGLPTLLEAAGRLRERRPGVRVVIVGEGPMEADLRRQVRARDLEPTVVLAGGRADAADVLAAADVVAVPSRWESGPLVVLEALQLGRPVVATPVGVVPEYVVDGETGRLVPVDDAVALAAALDDVLGDTDAAAALGEAGRRRVAERLRVDQQVDVVEQVYRAVAGARS